MSEVKYTGHGINTGGLQGHSIGPDYPYIIAGIGRLHSIRIGESELVTFWQTRNGATNFVAPVRETYKDAEVDLQLARLVDRAAYNIKHNPGYCSGYLYAQSDLTTGNPYDVDSPEYGAFGSGFFDARALVALKKVAYNLPNY